MSSSDPHHPSEDLPSSVRSSIADIPVETSPVDSTAALNTSKPAPRNSASLEWSREPDDDDLDIEDPLSRVYVRGDEFEPFSRTEIGFISASCIAVVSVPLLHLLVSRIQVFGISGRADVRGNWDLA
jgi:hypothetical protein